MAIALTPKRDDPLFFCRQSSPFHVNRSKMGVSCLLNPKLLLSFSALIICCPSDGVGSNLGPPRPKAWPQQFHSILVMNNSKNGFDTESEYQLQLIDLWYDWPNGRNFNIIQDQLGRLLYDLEWDNGTSFYYTLIDSSSSSPSCRTIHFDVGILRPDWLLDGANYLGQHRIGSFLCNVWDKADFITYYEDVLSQRPVHWFFHSGRAAHVMTFEVGAVLEDAHWQAPVYCFQNTSTTRYPHLKDHPYLSLWKFGSTAAAAA
ncbi:hypothetical protein RJ641_002525 [Dillenia turbinata]|uniref:Uncharacterized protein n=1 Tax=Dillenia turbinata TaxID=194707 RepID=A0AAN8VNU9_9MAGN